MRAGNDTDRRPPADTVRGWLESVTDPEIPVLTIADLGILQDIRWDGDELVVVITPTYSGCPAMRTIEQGVRDTVRAHGVDRVRVEERISPAWTTDWLTEAGRQKLRAYGIAPPEGRSTSKRGLFAPLPAVACPRCGSTNTTRVSEFGSTACKAHYRCDDCLEPFDYFKCI
ncbi:putative 1,2-phenylacetyl-CoA epoxidase, subunit D [wastewater metagenome]|uniref:Putative 1,2-phenylacetyl-CoA epoxidase, subunit D n=2 Tax=unclassified sequences TaxID=12908 RepID=A0A5B8R5G2_9ZZZZ|nr:MULTISPECIES: 1,2-phenylacetyl-CoA epoxidase subunit PaaD [Arhodomonas]MCS4502727.1 phenylacetate-CoA oxygenase subunit PaaJ [Arhodomonas aquaeolei]QEA03790.1 putative 1,2-phenylacetyl-CoA epoxidase, subunit D [uncultured organism]